MRPRYHETPVEDFHRTFAAPVAEVPTVPEPERRRLRLELILEELLELAAASQFKLIAVYINGDFDRFAFFPDKEGHLPNVVEAADALADLRYVVEGAALEWGVPLEACFAEVHRSNMSKVGADGRPILREDGKVLKGPGYEPPDIAGVIQKKVVEVYGD